MNDSKLTDSRDCLVVVATYNEIENLPKLVAEILDVLPSADVLIVDDASPDGTGDWVVKQQETELRLHLLSRTGKLGLGSAMIDALNWCLARRYKFLANLDADFSHPPAHLAELVACVQGDATVEVAIASRYVEGGGIEGWPWHRRIMSRLVNGFARVWFGLTPRDCSGSFRCYRVATLRRMGVERIVSHGYAFYEEILWRLRLIDARMVEVPYTYYERTRGQTKLNLGETIRSIFTLITLRWR